MNIRPSNYRRWLRYWKTDHGINVECEIYISVCVYLFGNNMIMISFHILFSSCQAICQNNENWHIPEILQQEVR